MKKTIRKLYLLTAILCTNSQILVSKMFIKYYVSRFSTCVRENKTWFANYFMELIQQEHEKKNLLNNKKERFKSKWNTYHSS